MEKNKRILTSGLDSLRSVLKAGQILLTWFRLNLIFTVRFNLNVASLPGFAVIQLDLNLNSERRQTCSSSLLMCAAPDCVAVTESGGEQ